ncbi:MAG: ABC transporter permease [Actinomycetota bacterium]
MSQVVAEPTAPDAIAVAAGEVVGRTPWQIFWGRFKKDKVAFVGAGFIILLGLVAILAPFIANHIIHHGPNQLLGSPNSSTGEPAVLPNVLSPIGLPTGPSGKLWFGADQSGRDLFVRVIYGAQTSLTVALLATGISVLIGVILGVVAGFTGGIIDTVIARTIDIVMSLPILLFAIGIAGACSISPQGCTIGFLHLEPGRNLVVFIIALVNWTYIARIVRGQTFSLREREFVESARALGAPGRRIMFREILPNLVAPIIVYATLIIPSNIIFEASLSFLGVGIPQDTPSWGRMLSDATQLFRVAWWMMLFPGLFLFLTTLSFNLLGDGLRDALDPRSGR